MHRTYHKLIPCFLSALHPGRLFRHAGSRIVASFMLLLFTLKIHADTPEDQPLPLPTYGINLGNTLEPPSGEGTWGPAASKAVIDSFAAEGFNSIRIPCSWNSNADPTTHEIDPVYMARVKQVVDWSLDAGLYVVINSHWDGGWLDNNVTSSFDTSIDEKVAVLWSQIATEFAGYDNRLLFAGSNEPSPSGPAAARTLLDYYQTFVDTVRGSGGNNTNRWLILPNVKDPSWMDVLPVDPTPNRMMVEYHAYMPTLFTLVHDDPSWGTSIFFWGSAYHYPNYSGDPLRNNTWYGEGYIETEMQILADEYENKGIPVIIGEFGSYPTKTLSGTEADYNRTSTLYWNHYVAEAARARGLHPFFWTIQSDVFDWSTGEVLDQDVVDVLTGGAAPAPLSGAPSAVTGLAATNTARGQINLSWNAVSGATSYSLYRAGDSGHECEAVPFATGVTGTTYTDTGLNDGTTYYYQVVAVNGNGPSGFTIEAHASTPGTNPDPAQFHFETGTQRWKADGNEISGVAVSSAKSYTGNQSLAVNFNGTAGGMSTVSRDNLVVPAGAMITFRIWAPSGHKISSVVPSIQDYNWNYWIGSGVSLTPNAWNTVTVTAPETLTAPFQHFGLQFTTSAAWTGTCYIDSISWEIPAPPAPLGLVSALADSTASLSWGWVSAADSYTVKRSTTSGSGYETIATGVTDLSYQDTDIVNGAIYYYVVSAEQSGVEGANSSEVTTALVPYHFESDEQDWIGGGDIVSNVATTTAQSYGGNQSLAVNFNGTASGTASAYVTNVAAVPGSTITFHVWIPAGSPVWALQPYTQDPNNNWNGSWYGSFTAGAWNTLTLTVPANAVSPLNTLGVQIFTSDAWTGTCYIDSVYVESPPQPPATPAGLAAVAGDGSVDLSWSAASGATGYTVKRSTTSGSGYVTITTTNSLALADSGLINGTFYYYVVSSTNGAGESADSAEVAVRPLATAPAPLDVVITNSQLEISWPADHTGWMLEYTTNLMDTNGWTLVPSSDATNVLNGGSITNESIFYRLVYP